MIKNLRKFMALSLFTLVAGLAGCVESGTATEDTVQEDNTTLPATEPELSELISNIAAQNSSATCFAVWECEVCGSFGRTRNILRDCNGNVVLRRTCGEPCF